MHAAIAAAIIMMIVIGADMAAVLLPVVRVAVLEATGIESHEAIVDEEQGILEIV